MRATVGGQPFEADSWLGVVSAVMLATGVRPKYDERHEAAKQLSKGVSVVITGGVLIKPEGARE